MDDEKRALINKLIVGVSRLNEESLVQLFDITRNELYHLTKEYFEDDEIREKVLSLTYVKIVRRAKRFDSCNCDGYDWMCDIVKDLSLKFQKKLLKKRAKKNHRCKEVK